MPYRRKYRKKKRMFRRKKKKSYSLMRVPRVYVFKRSLTEQVNLAGIAAPYHTKDFTFKLDQLPAFTEFSTLFRQFKIVSVKATITASHDSANHTTVTPSQVQVFRLYDFTGQFSAQTPMQWNQNQRVYGMNTIAPGRRLQKCFSIKPKVLVSAYRGTLAADGYSPQSRWIDILNPDVPHYGVQLQFRNVSNSNFNAGNNMAPIYAIRYTYHVAFRGVR